jgi:hypothetical protein
VFFLILHGSRSQNKFRSYTMIYSAKHVLELTGLNEFCSTGAEIKVAHNAFTYLS